MPGSTPSLMPSQTIKGAVFVVLAMANIGLIDNLVLFVAKEVGLWQFHFIRSIIGCLTLLVMAPFFGWRILPQNLPAVVVRSFLYATAMVLYFGCLSFMPIAQVGAGLFMSPVIVLILSAVLLRLPVGRLGIVASFVGFAGVLVILRLDSSALGLISFLPVCAGAIYALGMLSTRQYCANETTITLLFGFFLALGIYGAVGLAFINTGLISASDRFFLQSWQPMSQWFWVLVFIQALGSLVAVGCLTRGYLIAPAAQVAVFEYTFLIFASFWGWVIWKDALDAPTILGITLILFSGLLIYLNEKRAQSG